MSPSLIAVRRHFHRQGPERRRPSSWASSGLIASMVLATAAGTGASACHGTTPASSAAAGASAAEAGPGERGAAAQSKGQRCLEDANAAHTRRADAPERIELAQILVRHAELARPLGATRSREAACLRALEALEKLQGGAEWDATVDSLSDAAGATHGGLGSVSAEELPKTIADAAFSLEVDQLSYVVESDRGFHVLLRTR